MGSGAVSGVGDAGGTFELVDLKYLFAVWWEVAPSEGARRERSEADRAAESIPSFAVSLLYYR